MATVRWVVNAAGVWADVVAGLAVVAPVGLVPYRTTAFVSPASFATTGLPTVVDVDQQFYFKPETGRFMGSLAEETPMEPHDVRPHEIDVALAAERIHSATTLDSRHVSRTWARLRTFAPTVFLLPGWIPTTPGSSGSPGKVALGS
jgi:D-arginine dehydrogenase